MSNNSNLIDIFKTNLQKHSPTIALNIINSICTSKFGCPNNDYNSEIVSFVNFLKKSNPELYETNKDLIVFRLYEEAIKIDLQQIKTNASAFLTPEQITVATKFSNKILQQNKVFNCLFNIDNKIYYTTTKNKNDFLSLAEFSLYSKNALILFMENVAKPCAFCFVLENNDFKELKPTNSMKDEIFSDFSYELDFSTTFSQLYPEIA
jgi:hypothetical protein